MAKTQVVAGIDVGGTNTAFGFVDKAGRCIYESSIPTYSDKPADQLFERVVYEINKAFKQFDAEYELVGIGIGAPNANYYTGSVELPPNLNWGIVNIVELLKNFTSLPSAITNDANAAAIGEMLFGAGKGMKNFVVITLGTGLGSGIIVNGELVYGADGFAGEIGHSVIEFNGRDCGCGRKGCLETYASATGIRRTVAELIGTTTIASELRSRNFADLTAKEIADAANKGDKLALQAFDDTAKYLGFELANTVAYLSPEAIILFGGLAESGDLLMIPTKKYMESFMLNIFKNKVKILKSNLPNGNAAVIGASALMWNELAKH